MPDQILQYTSPPVTRHLPAKPSSPLTWPDDALNRPFLKERLDEFHRWLADAFDAGETTETLVDARTLYIDQLLRQLWYYHGFASVPHTALVAVGDYGRGELHPLSDIDVLVLSQASLTPPLQQYISELLTLLWDLKLEVGHSVRSIEECLEEGRADLTVSTNLIESRLISGDLALFLTLQKQLFSDDFWPSRVFFSAKLAEQQERHLRYS